jgi:PAS domain S-box-containing protein
MPTPSRGLTRISGEPDAGSLEAQLAAERAERCRLQNELGLRDSALNSASSHFLILDVTQSPWKIVFANRAVARDHGYAAAELLGRSPSMFSDEEQNREAFSRLRQAVRCGNNASEEMVSRRRDGSTFCVGMFLTPVCPADGSDISHYLVIGADITARLEQERARQLLQEQLYNEMKERERMGIELQLAQKLESVGRLAAGIAHEINTPIQYIGDSVSFLQATQAELAQLRTAYQGAMQQMQDSAHAREAMESVHAAQQALDLSFVDTEVPKAFARTMEGVQRVAAIVRAMKEFAHPDSGEQNPADLNHAIETTLLVAHNEYKYSAQVETGLGELPEVVCNIGELNQVFLNLIVNAAHAIAESGQDAQSGRITITTRVAGEQAEIVIADNGCGISAENLERIFDPFFTTKPVGRGTGQGLAITRTIVIEKHGGRVDVESTLGSGTRFVLRLPIYGRQAVRAA